MMTDLTLAAARMGIDLDPAVPYAQELIGEKHLPGEHSQATHGGGGGSSRNATLSDSYQQAYGDARDEWTVGDVLTLVLTERGEGHVANDGGAEREVLFDFDGPDEAREMSEQLNTMADDWDDLLSE